MTKILCLASYPFLPAHTGGQKHIALFYKYLSKKAELICVTTKNNDTRAAEGYEVLNILSTSKLRYINLFYFFQLKKIIRQRKITHLLIEHPYYGWLAAWLQAATGVKLIVRSHNIEGLRWKALSKWWWQIMLSYEGWIHRRADLSFFITPEDMAYGMENFRLDQQNCLLVTYGIECDQAPAPAEKSAAREQLMAVHNIPAQHKILLFNGAFNYAPNRRALEGILAHVNPFLQQAGLLYTLIICGKDIPTTGKQYPNIVFAGFVKDIGLYLKGADIFLNPIAEGGGIKTKLVEALGLDLNAVSFTHGAIGIDPELCNGKLVVVADNEWRRFSKTVMQQAGLEKHISPEFFDYFYWGNIVRRVAARLY